MPSFFGELRRRNVFKVAVAYAVVSWLLIEIAATVLPIFEAPDWIVQVFTFLIILGFPVALILSWAYELTPDGMVRDQGEAAPAHGGWHTGELVLIGLLVVAVGWLGYRQFGPWADPAQQASGLMRNSVAVLPFENLSLDPEDAFFAAGIHESTLNQLSKIRDLSVIARTSVLQYENDPPPIPEIAAALKVEMVMEGSVRYANDRVLITVQLIDGRTGAHLWSEEYNRGLMDVFAVQAEIARNIAAALEAELRPSEMASIETSPTESPEAYAAFLRAMAIFGGGESAIGVAASPGTRAVIQSYLDDALELDPGFALAHAWKATIFNLSRSFDPFTADDWLDRKSELDRLVSEHVDRALALDPSIGLAHAARGYMFLLNWSGELAEPEAEQALRLSPNDPFVLIFYAIVERYLGRHEEAIRSLQRAANLDPSNIAVHQELGDGFLPIGRYAESIAASQRCLTLDPGEPVCSIMLARSEWARGNDEAALDALRRTEQLLPSDAAPVIRAELVYAYGLLGQPEEAQRAFDFVEELAADLYVDSTAWAWANMGLGDYVEALSRLDSAADNTELLQMPWAAFYIRDNVWSDPVLEEPDWVAMRDRLDLALR